MHPMNDLLPKQQTPGQHRIQVQRIIIAGKFGEGKLIVRCKYTLGIVYLSFWIPVAVFGFLTSTNL